jgi:hypothetical protein
MVQNIPTFRDPSFKQNVITTILDVCCYNNYASVTNYTWLTCEVLFNIAKQVALMSVSAQSTGRGIENIQKLDKRISFILIDLSIRVEEIRQAKLLKTCSDLVLSKQV